MTSSLSVHYPLEFYLGFGQNSFLFVFFILRQSDFNCGASGISGYLNALMTNVNSFFSIGSWYVGILLRFCSATLRSKLFWNVLRSMPNFIQGEIHRLGLGHHPGRHPRVQRKCMQHSPNSWFLWRKFSSHGRHGI